MKHLQQNQLAYTSKWHRCLTFTFQISPRIFVQIRNGPQGPRRNCHEKKTWSRKSRDRLPLKRPLLQRQDTEGPRWNAFHQASDCCRPVLLQCQVIQIVTRRPVLEIIDPVFAKTSPKRSFSMTDYERFGLVFTKTRVYKFRHSSILSFWLDVP